VNFLLCSAVPARRPQDGIEQLQSAMLVSFSHPSTHGALNLRLNERMPYLVNVAEPMTGRVRGGG
jgi:hypothetical protein